ncbi:glycoside hydrolase family 78 protein [Mucilaginibacter sp. HMF5004]|uniref:glycoside hydrolase family 78 protein n=1 Tax=Mucilaginibacter rivuli TaxID=2857527 RepID=UPI001C5D802A|nr:glycoside hydrolase family 78 protein [Mucilaginibacter rivuli]MBW4889009.1 glycoside hydrolase family 78 protein [Mucilaginibacter rivuli]
MMRKYLLLNMLLLIAISTFAQSLSVSNLRCNSRKDADGIVTAHPVLSWNLNSDGHNVMQSAYRVLVADDASVLQKGTGNVWDSQKVNLGASINVAYTGKSLQAAKTYYWRVMVWDNQKHASQWSAIGKWQMGLLTVADWKNAAWIGYEVMPDSVKILPHLTEKGEKKRSPGLDILPILRKNFAINRPVKNATMFISGLGHFEMNLNGQKVGDHFLDAGWVNYQKEALYTSFDLTNLLKHGENAIGVSLGNGMYFTPSGRYRKLTVAYGYPKMKCCLRIEYADGTSENMVSNTSWKTTAGPITFSAMYGGEDYDATKEQAGWDKPEFDDKGWKNALVVDGPPQLNPQTTEPLKIFDVFEPKKVTQPKPGVWVYDLGQNASGIPQITVKGKRGDTVKITPAELLTADGLANQNATGKSHYYTYVLKGDGAETWQPRFTYYGFRYVQVDGAIPQGEANANGKPQVIALKGLHTRNAAAQVGSFWCSNELFNKTNTLIDWSIKSNMVSVLTDCPHRERLGWLEQDNLVGNSLQYNYDLETMFKKVINDMKLSQTEDGLIPEIAPEFTVFDGGFRDSPEWGSTAIMLPWYVYQWYGDKQVLFDSYDMMKRYVDYLEKKSNNHILTQGLGDWYDLGPKRPGVSQLTPQGITATAYYYYDLCILAKIARMAGKQAEALAFEKRGVEVRKAFNDKFFDKATKQYGTGSQTANSIAVYMGLVDPADKAAVVDNIVKDVRAHNNSLTAGDVGYRYLLRVLEQEGHSDVIFEMNNRSDVPGYGYQLAKGATALTESWQALPSVSNNHFMLGHIMEWFYEDLAGIRPTEGAVAYNHIEIRPQPVGDVTSAKANYNSAYGLIASDWKKQDKIFDLTVNIPVNTTASVYLPVDAASKIIMNDKPVSGVYYNNKGVMIAVGSGSYTFRAVKK